MRHRWGTVGVMEQVMGWACGRKERLFLMWVPEGPSRAKAKENSVSSIADSLGDVGV